MALHNIQNTLRIQETQCVHPLKDRTGELCIGKQWLFMTRMIHNV